MAGARDIKRRIKSITSTKKITRAMQMISAVKMRKAQNTALASRRYSDLAWEIVNNLSGKVHPKYHALLQGAGIANGKKATNKIGLILVSTNRGQVGGFNSNLVSAANKYLAGESELVAELTVVGRKGRDAMVRLGKSIIAEFPKNDKPIPVEDILPISQMVIREYLKGNYQKIAIVYMSYISTINQKPKIIQLLPFTGISDYGSTNKEANPAKYEYLFEPDPEKVLDYLLPRIIQAQVYQAVLENDASEHSARMIMMKNATDAAGDLIDDLSLTYNQIRQANITRELAEITAGSSAIE